MSQEEKSEFGAEFIRHLLMGDLSEWIGKFADDFYSKRGIIVRTETIEPKNERSTVFCRLAKIPMLKAEDVKHILQDSDGYDVTLGKGRYGVTLIVERLEEEPE